MENDHKFFVEQMFERDKNSWKAFSSTTAKDTQQLGMSSGARYENTAKYMHFVGPFESCISLMVISS